MNRIYFSLLFLLVLVAKPSSAQVRTDLYFDPADQRIHADVKTAVSRSRLHMNVSAIETGIESLPGFTGFHGGNLQTAYEIDQLITGDLLEILTFDSKGQSQGPSTLIPGARERVPVRRITFEGDIVFEAFSHEFYRLSFEAIGPALREGTYLTEIRARGENRLRIEVAVGPDGTGSILGFTEVPHGDVFPENAGGLFRFISTEGAEEDPYVAPVEKADWAKRDVESKWVLFKKSVSDGAKLKNWIRFLDKEKDYPFLEMVALYQIDAFHHHGVGDRLAKADAPNWLRVVNWMRGQKPPVRGHGWTVMDGLFLAEDRQDVIYSWIKAHKLENLYPAILDTMTARKVKPKEIDVSKYDAPYQLDEFIKWLKPPAALEVLPVEAVKSGPEKVYLHQVLRVIDMMVTSGRIGNPEVLDRLKAMRQHPNERVRQAVYLGYTHLPLALVPLDLMAVVQDEKETRRVREAALLSHSYRFDPEIYPDLIDVASTPNHPAWDAAVSRLGEKLGDGFSLERLRKLDLDDKEKSKLLGSAMENIEKRLASHQEKKKSLQNLFKTRFLRAAWLRHQNHPLAEAYYTWLSKEVDQHREQLTVLLEKKLPETNFVTYSVRNEQDRISLSVSLTLTLRELASELDDGKEN